ncbi:MAG: hypothetical protein ACYTG5_17550 [Planctomycetota bacterium]|jgi:hypothetical protein
MRILLLIALFAMGSQDPQGKTRPASAPKDRKALSPVQEPFRSSVERRDLLQRFAAVSPLEGLFKLERYSLPGRGEINGCSGYIFFGRQHMQLYLQVAQKGSAKPLVQASVRRYALRGQQLMMTSLEGHAVGSEGNLSMEQGRNTESRQVDLAGTKLRLSKADGSYMELVRVE